MPNDYISEAFERWYTTGGDRQRLKDAFRAGWLACAQVVYSQIAEMDLSPGAGGLAIGQGEYPFEDL